MPLNAHYPPHRGSKQHSVVSAQLGHKQTTTITDMHSTIDQTLLGIYKLTYVDVTCVFCSSTLLFARMMMIMIMNNFNFVYFNNDDYLIFAFFIVVF